MELIKNLRWICRICTVNIKKRKSSQSAVPIFDTPLLSEKLTKYLFIEIDPGDELPKKICGNCYKRIESFHSFVSLANKTENFLKDFINITKGNVVDTDSFESLNNKFQGEFASFTLLSADKREVIMNDLAVNDAGELILNVSVNDPLIKDMANKIDLATKQGSLKFERHITQHEINKSKSLPGSFFNISNDEISVNNDDQLAQPQNITSHENFPPHLLLANNKIQQEEILNRSSVETYDCLNLGSVIKDMDLLKLILKALKWPYTKNNLSAQIQKLKSTRLRDVITDPNLLQDTDMTQILRSYLSPVILQSHNNNTPYQNTATSMALNSLSSIVPYRIPADTSVQLISVPSSDAANYYNDCHHDQNVTKTNYYRKSPLPIVLSDDSNDNDVQLFEVSVDPRLYFPGEKEFYFHQYNSTESLTENSVASPTIVRAENSKTKVRKKHKRKESHTNDLSYEKIPSERQEIAIDKNPRERISVHHKITSDQRISTKPIVVEDNEGFKDFDIDSITLIEEASEDDQIWAEFKVTESPDNSEMEDYNEEIHIKSEASGEVPILHNIKQVDEKSYAKFTTNKRKPMIENIKEELSTKLTKKKTISNKNVKKELKCKTSRKKSVRSNVHLKDANERITREKIPRTYFNKRKQKNKKQSEKPRSQTNRKKQKLIEKESVQSPRKSNARKRICKQCGLTFTNILDFVKHRKEHM